MGNKRNIRNGYILKSVFCKENGISISDFNQVMQEKGYLVNSLISTDMFGNNKKYALSINSSYIEPLHGSNQQGSYQQSKKFLLDVFGFKSMTKSDYSNYKLNFGKFKGVKFSEMVSDEQIQYLTWLHNNMLRNNDTESEKYRAINWFINKLYI